MILSRHDSVEIRRLLNVVSRFQAHDAAGSVVQEKAETSLLVLQHHSAKGHPFSRDEIGHAPAEGPRLGAEDQVELGPSQVSYTTVGG